MAVYIKFFDQISKKDIGVAGGKGANLGEMFQAGFPVPPGFIVTAEAYWDFVESTGLKEQIQEVLNDLNVDDNDSLQSSAKKIQELIKNEQMPEKIAKKIISAYDKLRGKDDKYYVAVRSSATAEDLPDASFAGQQETFLNVIGGDALVGFVQKCWASLFTARATYYREKNDFPHMKVKIAVVVQKMVNSEISGVAFSVHPSTGEEKVIIEAGYGLGEAIVQGSINPDYYEIDKETWQLLKKDVKKQEKMIVKTGDNKSEWVDVPGDKQEAQVISDEQVIQLAKLIQEIHEHYGKPQDIEWAVEDNHLYITQSRPVTTIKEKEKEQKPITEITKGQEVLLHGLGASPGVASGNVIKIKDASELEKVKEGMILVTKMTDPNMVPAMKRAAGIITDEGGMTCHAAIVSRELGIPCIVGTVKATSMFNDGDEVTLDATNGVIYKGRPKEIVGGTKPLATPTMVSPVLRHIVTGIQIHANLSTPGLAEEVSKKDVDGVGLLRAEFIAAELNIHPSVLIKENRGQEFVDKFAQDIAKVARLFNPRPITYRFLDFKSNEYKDLPGGSDYEPDERNPMIGWRGASRYISPEYVDTFKLELEAVRKVVFEYGMRNIELMIPFVRNTWELEEIMKIIEQAGLKNIGLKIGIMVEVPSTVILIDRFCKMGIDFVSIGSNDLTQLVMGVDRDNAKLGKWFDERNEAVLRCLKRVIRICKKHGVTTSICGQAPSVYPKITEFLVDCGIDKISVNPDVIERTRKLVAQVEHKIWLERNLKEETERTDADL